MSEVNAHMKITFYIPVKSRQGEERMLARFKLYMSELPFYLKLVEKFKIFPYNSPNISCAFCGIEV